MPTMYDASKVENLSEADKMRLIVAYLNHSEPNNVNWDLAATEAGSKSKGSYKKLVANALKKLTPDTVVEGDDGLSATLPLSITKSVSAPAAKQGRKRAASVDDGEDDDVKAEKEGTKRRKAPTKKAVKKEDGEEAM
ncbi:mads box transcription factor mcm1 [Diplodia corticola]|uniref:Mads box transcription factor mcm1 n=1 Tax=Diplodia corticola TaxID=236234 RepID=A0A1J9RZB3_9PEZI|nr:mads box transcription factor mcm1 [Diplodia corticola]OJD32789.1 mads box transcription factor mcm1 [Diplodia corticola]